MRTRQVVESLLEGSADAGGPNSEVIINQRFNLDPLAVFTKMLVDGRHFNPLSAELRNLQAELAKVQRLEWQRECDRQMQEFIEESRRWENAEFEDDVNFIMDLLIKGNKDDIRRDLERQEELMTNKLTAKNKNNK